MQRAANRQDIRQYARQGYVGQRSNRRVRLRSTRRSSRRLWSRSRHQGAKLAVALLLAVVLVVLVCLGWTYLPAVFGHWAAPTPANLSAPGTEPGTEPGIEQSAQPLSNAQDFATPLSVAELNDTGFVQLVNQEHSFSAELPQHVLQTAYPTVDALSKDILVHATALEAVAELAAAAYQEQVGSLVVNSGYRSYSEQAQLYDEAPDKSYVQQAGFSEHHTGLAVDIELLATGGSPAAGDSSSQALTDETLSMEEAGEEQARRAAEWTAENAWEYGLLLRYPSDKQAMTQVPYEPWHFRYVGLPHAWYCWKYNLCLEEYLESLQESGGYQVTLQGRTWYVSYQAQAAQDGVVYIPEGLNYEVSADGCGGYLVTAWN